MSETSAPVLPRTGLADANPLSRKERARNSHLSILTNDVLGKETVTPVISQSGVTLLAQMAGQCILYVGPEPAVDAQWNLYCIVHNIGKIAAFANTAKL